MTRAGLCNDTHASPIDVVVTSPDSLDCLIFECNKWDWSVICQSNLKHILLTCPTFSSCFCRHPEFPV